MLVKILLEVQVLVMSRSTTVFFKRRATGQENQYRES